MSDWQSDGKMWLAGMSLNMVELVRAAVPRVRNDALRHELEEFCAGKRTEISQAALDALDAAITEVLMLRRKKRDARDESLTREARLGNLASPNSHTEGGLTPCQST